MFRLVSSIRFGSDGGAWSVLKIIEGELDWDVMSRLLSRDGEGQQSVGVLCVCTFSKEWK